MKTTKYLALFFAVAVIGAISGCGGGGAGPEVKISGEAGDIDELIASMADYARNADTFNPLFADGKAPNDRERRRYNTFSIYHDREDITIEGDTAKIEVEIKDPDDFDTEVGEMFTWTAVKQGDEWKLDEAPLPPPK